MEGVGGYEGWRWYVWHVRSLGITELRSYNRIFIIEGLITVIITFAAFFLIAPWPEDCKFLKPHEKDMMLQRCAADRLHIKHDILTLRSFVTTLTDWKIWIG